MGRREIELTEEILGLSRRNSTATVLFHHAIAERLGLGPSDHKCLDLVRERGPMTAARLAALTGLTTGAITGVVARLERGGLLARRPDPHDGRKQILSMTDLAHQRIGEVFADVAGGTADALLAGFDADQLTTVAEFLRRATDLTHHRTALLRARALVDPPARPDRGPTTPPHDEEPPT